MSSDSGFGSHSGDSGVTGAEAAHLVDSIDEGPAHDVPGHEAAHVAAVAADGRAARRLDGDQKSGVVSTIVRFRQTQPLTSVPDRVLRTQNQGLCLRLKLSYCVIDRE